MALCAGIMAHRALAAALLCASIALSASAIAADDCDDGLFCNGVSVRLSSGECSPTVLPCDDNDRSTKDGCDEAQKRCTHTLKRRLAKKESSPCRADCEPSCDGLACGEDGCGGRSALFPEGGKEGGAVAMEVYIMTSASMKKEENGGALYLDQWMHMHVDASFKSKVMIISPPPPPPGFCGECPFGSGCANGVCVEGVAAGTCASPLQLTEDGSTLTLSGSERITVTVAGDTGSALHVMTPSCNELTAAPELVYTFVVAAGATFGYDIRSTGYDTVLQLYKGACTKDQVMSCADDATPPGDLGSRVAGMATAGTYYVMVDGYSSADYGPFELSLTFVPDCLPLCDGNFCGPDNCGGICGTCGANDTCNAVDFRCYPNACEPQCGERECGDDGCGKSGGVGRG